MEQVDCVVVGAGVVGLAIARTLARQGREVIVLEREARIGEHTSSRNSEVIHAGLHYKTGTIRAQLFRRPARCCTPIALNIACCIVGSERSWWGVRAPKPIG